LHIKDACQIVIYVFGLDATASFSGPNDWLECSIKYPLPDGSSLK